MRLRCGNAFRVDSGGGGLGGGTSPLQSNPFLPVILPRSRFVLPPCPTTPSAQHNTYLTWSTKGMFWDPSMPVQKRIERFVASETLIMCA